MTTVSGTAPTTPTVISARRKVQSETSDCGHCQPCAADCHVGRAGKNAGPVQIVLSVAQDRARNVPRPGEGGRQAALPQAAWAEGWRISVDETDKYVSAGAL